MHKETERFQKRIGRQLFKLRRDESQEKLAARAGLSVATVNHIENGEANPTLDVLVRLANALGVELPVLVQW